LRAVALAKAGPRFGWQAGASLGPQALLTLASRQPRAASRAIPERH
jgi:hypothetical protein